MKEYGVLVGIIMSLLVLLMKTTQPHYAVLGKIPNEPLYRNIRRFPDLEICDDTLIIRFDAGLYFANVGYFKQIIKENIATKGENLKALFLDADPINNIDSSAIHALEEVVQDCREQGIEFFMIAVKGPVRDALSKSKLTEKIGQDNFFLEVHHAIKTYRKEHQDSFSTYTLQVDE